MKVLVMIPTYNEKENIEPMIKTILNLEHAPEMKQLGVEKLQIVIVDDSSPDGTGGLVVKMGEEYPAKIHLIERHERGRGTAGITGFKYALTQDIDCLIEMDADFSHDPKYIPKFLKEINHHDIVNASRFIKGSKRRRSLIRNMVSRGASCYTQLILGSKVKDWHSGYRCYRREALASLDLDAFISKGYSIVMETMYRLIRKGFDVVEIPIVFEDRREGKSKFSLKEILAFMAIVMLLRRRVEA